MHNLKKAIWRLQILVSIGIVMLTFLIIREGTQPKIRIVPPITTTQSIDYGIILNGTSIKIVTDYGDTVSINDLNEIEEFIINDNI